MVVITPTPKFIIHLRETDGEIIIKEITPGSLEEYLRVRRLGQKDYAIIRGELLKSFENTTLNLKGV